MRRGWFPWMLAAGDVLAVLAFTLAGLANHRSGVTLDGFVRNAGPILLVWAAAAVPLRTYTRPGVRSFLPTWAVAVVGGVSLRTLWLGHPTGVRFLTFLGVTAAMTLLFVGGWRLLAAGVERMLARPRASAAP